MFHEGKQLGEYTLVKKLGRGGFGEVWLAETGGSRFAVKLSHQNLVDWKAVTQEIGIWTLCGRHPNVVPLLGAKNFDGQIAIISEYVPDGSLDDLLKARGGSLSIAESAQMINGILRGLQHLHTSGIIHSDLKPANILLDGNTPRLTDFGISRASKHTNTLSETIAGTLKYMAPECFDGKRNAQTDIWAVGVIFYQMLSGRLPFAEEETVQLIASVVMKEPPPLPDLVPPALKNIIGTALAKNPAGRFQTAEQMRQNLAAVAERDLNTKIIENVTENIRQPIPETVFVERTVQTAIANRQTSGSQTPKKSPGWLYVLGFSSIILLLLIAAGGMGIYHLVKNGEGDKPSSPTRTPRYSPYPTSPPSTAKTFIYETPGRIEEILDQIEQRHGGQMKIISLSIYFGGASEYFSVHVQDNNNPENVDIYRYQDGNITKEPSRVSSAFQSYPFSRSEINWSIIPDLVKTAKEKSKDLEGAKIPSVNVSNKGYKKKEIQISVSIRGARKDFLLSADSKGGNQKTEIK